MTDKHIWKNGETITADLLNGMSDYADEKVDAIPKIDPDTLVKTTALASDENLLIGTSSDWQNRTDIVPPDRYYNFVAAKNGNKVLTLEAGKTYSYQVCVKATYDVTSVLQLFSKAGNGLTFTGNKVAAGKSGYSAVTFTVPNSDYYIVLTAPLHSASNNLDTTVKQTVQWRQEKLNIGPYPTLYSDAPIKQANLEAFPTLGGDNVFDGTNSFSGANTTVKVDSSNALIKGDAGNGAISVLKQYATASTNGDGIVLSGNAVTVIGGGEAGTNFANAIVKQTQPPAIAQMKDIGDESVVLVADNNMYFGTGYNAGGASGSWWQINDKGVLQQYVNGAWVPVAMQTDIESLTKRIETLEAKQ